MTWRMFLVCLNLDSAVICSAEPMRFDESEFDEIRDVISREPVAFGVLDAMFNSPSSQTKGPGLTKAIRECLSVLRKDISDPTRQKMFGLIDDCTWALEKNEALCVWTEYIPPGEEGDD